MSSETGMIRRWTQSSGERHPSDRQKTPRIIAAGLWRCATSSLQEAFEEHLGLAPSMHGVYIMPHNSRLKLCCAANLEADRSKRQKTLHCLFDGYAAMSDYPGHAFVDDLMDMYPDAVVLLNQRSSAEAWRQSALASLSFYSTVWYLVACGWVPQSYWHWKLYSTFRVNARRRLGLEDIWSQEMYHRHNEWVRGEAQKRGRVVVEWEPAMGWQPICESLGIDEPEADFPETNEEASMRQLKRYLIWRGLMAWMILSSLVAICGCVAMFYLKRVSFGK